MKESRSEIKDQINKRRNSIFSAENVRILPCPMCGGKKTSSCGTIKGYSFKRCAKCEFVFSPSITPEHLSDLYAEGFHGPKDGGPKKGWSKDVSFLNPAFELLSERKKLNILDFGSGQSLVSEHLREIGHKVTAVDVAPPLKPHPDRLTGDILNLDLAEEYYDLVFSFQVFEHLPDPRPYLEKLLKLLNDEGLLLIHTDMETPERDEGDFEDWWYVSPPDHCSFYRIHTFRVFLEKTNHSLVYSSPKSVIIKKINK